MPTRQRGTTASASAVQLPFDARLITEFDGGFDGRSGGLPDRALACAFVAGLPDSVRQTIRAGSRAEALDLDSVLVRARAVLSDVRVAAGAAATRGKKRSRGPWPPEAHQQRSCWTCGETCHIASSCPARVAGNGTGGGTSARRQPGLQCPAPVRRVHGRGRVRVHEYILNHASRVLARVGCVDVRPAST